MAETETLTIFLDSRRDRDETLVRLETVSRPRRRDRDHNPAFDLTFVVNRLSREETLFKIWTTQTDNAGLSYFRRRYVTL